MKLILLILVIMAFAWWMAKNFPSQNEGGFR